MDHSVEPLSSPGAGLTAQEEAFLRAYSETLDRMAALHQAGLGAVGVPGGEVEQRLMALAGGIVAKAERMSLGAISSAMGADKMYMVHHIMRVCSSVKLHEVSKGLMLLGRIHGVYDKDVSMSRHQVALIFGAPIEKPEPRRANLPFVIEAEYSEEPIEGD